MQVDVGIVISKEIGHPRSVKQRVVNNARYLSGEEKKRYK
jgi:hypothetical protein